MFDCANVEMRELLPELVAGLLDARTRARVEEHVAACAECASELETLRLVRASFSSAPAIDARRVVAALPKPSSVGQPTSRPSPPPIRRWLDWRIAAAVTTITVGGLSLAVSERLRSPVSVVPPDSVVVGPPVAAAIDTSASVVPPAPRAGTPQTATPPRVVTPRDRGTKAQLAFGGGDLDDASLQALLGALDEIDRAPVAPSAEPDRTPVLPVIKEGDR
jgi:anti-sigma factor RsiW